MASDASPPGTDEVKVRRRRRREQEVRRKEAQKEVDIEELTSAGHRALQEGRTEDALSCFNNGLKAAQQVRTLRSKVTDRSYCGGQRSPTGQTAEVKGH